MESEKCTANGDSQEWLERTYLDTKENTQDGTQVTRLGRRTRIPCWRLEAWQVHRGESVHVLIGLSKKLDAPDGLKNRVDVVQVLLKMKAARYPRIML
jgi:hypothetical protein